MKDFSNIAALQQAIHDAGDTGRIIYVSLEHRREDIEVRVHDHIHEMVTMMPSLPGAGMSYIDQTWKDQHTPVCPLCEAGIPFTRTLEEKVFEIVAREVPDLWAIKALPRERKHWEHLRKSRW